MKSDLHEPSGPALGDTSRTLDQAQSRALEGLGYPFRAIVTLMAALALAVIWLVLPVSQEGFLRPTKVPVGRGAGQGLAWTLTVPIVLSWLVLIWLRTRQLSRAREQNVHVLTALGAATSNIPVNLRTRMPLVLVTGDALGNLFDRIAGERRLAHVGDGAIWLRADRLQDLPRLAVAVKQWRDGRAPDGVVLSVAPALHAGEDVLTQNLRVVRQSVADASRMLGVRLPGFVAVYQRLTNAPATLAMPQWYGVSSATRLADASRFEAVVQVAETEVERAGGDRSVAASVAARAASLASIVGWTQRVVIGVLSDRRQPATPWTLFGAGWIDCGPASGPGRPWERDVEMQTRVVPPALPASPLPWPLPQPLIEAMPRRLWMSPRLAALAHAVALVACAIAVAFWGAARNNQALITRIGADLGRYSMIPAAHDAAKRDALQALVADRDQLDRYSRTGVPLGLSFGMYRGAQLMPALNQAIATYQPPPPPPAVVTLDSMSLFDSGRAQLKPGSTRAMVGALEMIRSHPDKRILVAGYTDNVGSPDSNLTLSVARAGAVRDWLIEVSGIAATQFAIQGYGDTRPIASNDTQEGRARNRRVEITLVPDAPKEIPLEDSTR
ncbi:OmpA family protein [Paraburkholderia sp. Cpub6]|uniref:OmpA family protein n=1 Tax=Paraburkholderia sp. Cpub6 TaxID=2723094 RepID=UPI0017FFD835|nr:outer membrane protein OmpA-like peptidoglycan-associated protein [Paraburkholderia sp. Cpub6]